MKNLNIFFAILMTVSLGLLLFTIPYKTLPDVSAMAFIIFMISSVTFVISRTKSHKKASVETFTKVFQTEARYKIVQMILFTICGILCLVFLAFNYPTIPVVIKVIAFLMILIFWGTVYYIWQNEKINIVLKGDIAFENDIGLIKIIKYSICPNRNVSEILFRSGDKWIVITPPFNMKVLQTGKILIETLGKQVTYSYMVKDKNKNANRKVELTFHRKSAEKSEFETIIETLLGSVYFNCEELTTD
jgi:hypothetical protein